MRDKTHQAVSLAQQGELLLPKVNRIVVQDLKERIILTGRQRYLQYFADEIGENGATTSTLRLKMSHVGHGHVVGHFISVVPIQVAIHHSRAETVGGEFFYVTINFLGPLQEQLALLIELAIVIEVVDVEFESAATDEGNVFVGNFVALFRDNLERCANAMRFVEINELAGKVPARGGFHVVGDNQRVGSAIGPKPDERHSLNAIGLHREPQDSLVQGVHGEIHRPPGE